MIIPTEADILQKDSCEQSQHINSSLGILRHNLISTVGLVYIQDLFPHASGQSTVDEICIGTVILTDSNRSINAHQLRQLITKQSLFKLDNKYIFLTNFGTTVTISQETTIELKHLINTENIVKFKKDCGLEEKVCSIIGQYSNGHGHMLGHVNATYETSLQNLRNKIDDVLRNVRLNNIRLSTNYYFVHSFYYTINRNNEINFLLVDIVRNHCIFLKFEMPLDVCVPGPGISMPDRNRTGPYKYSSTDDIAVTDDQTDSVTTKNKSIQKKATFLAKRKINRLPKSTLKTLRKQIMISYSRQEGAEQALNLKKALIKLDFSVYLDVHEIQMGSDWQDSLNDAIHNCKYFVPLITPMYGKTQWTNREVKMADVLNKHIIPINFLNYWPPECLAIQFATTQYISWRKPDPDAQDKTFDIKNWDIESIDYVTKLIVEQIGKLNKSETKKEVKINVPTSSSPDLTELVDTTSESAHASFNDKPLIVISVHPDQYSVSMRIKEILSSQYQVWCSNVLPEPVNSHQRISEISSKDSGYESNLSSIPEKACPSIDPEIQNYARKVVENSKQRPKSVPNREHTEIALKKRDLSRIVSYNPDASYLSSISPDKMNRLKHFQEKVLSSSLVVIIASEQYYKSRTSEQHVYYCGQRKKTILVQSDKSPAPVWFSKLMCQDVPLNYDSDNFNGELLYKIKTMLDPSCKFMEDVHETKIKYLADCMKKNLPNLETCVYVLGRVDVQDHFTVDICNAIGKELAAVVNINIVTNGFYGAGDIVACNFAEERASDKGSTDSVIHILPIRDPNNYKNKCRQNSDYTFEKVSYGQNLFMGESVKERDSVIARLLDTCILIDGEKDSVHEIEEFIWNDHFVIPVRSSRNQHNFPEKIFNCPNGVREEKWAVLSDPDATPVEIAKAVVNIICDLKKAIHEHAASKNNSNIKKTLSDKPSKKRTAVRKRLNIQVNQKSISEKINEIPREPSSPDKVLPETENEPAIEDKSKKGMFIKMIRNIIH